MILSDTDIREMLREGKLEVEPFNESQIQPASIDLTLGNVFGKIITRKNETILPNREPKYEMVTADRYLLDPGEFILATTKEYFRIPNDIAAFVEGRNSYGRLGLFVQNAGWVEPGFQGRITLTFFNASPASIVLESGTRLGKMVFEKTNTPSEHPYSGKYQGQTGTTGSMAYKDYE